MIVRFLVYHINTHQMSITMRDILQIEELQDASVLAGNKGMNKIICRIATIEKPFVDHPDYCYRVVKPHDIYFSKLYAFHNEEEKLFAELDFMHETDCSGLITHKEEIAVLNEEFLKKADAYSIPIIAINNSVGLTELTYHIINLIIKDGVAQIQKANLENLLAKGATEEEYQQQIVDITGVLHPFVQSIFVKTEDKVSLNAFHVYPEDLLLPMFDGMLYFMNCKSEQQLAEKKKSFLHKVKSTSSAYRVGVGGVHENTSIKRTILESLHAFSFADFLKKENCEYFSLREYILLLELNKSECLKDWRDMFYDPLKEYDMNAKLDLIHLMELFVKKEGDYACIGNELHIHETTVRYRLNKIYEILNLHSPAQFYAEAKIAVYAEWILKNPLLNKIK